MDLPFRPLTQADGKRLLPFLARYPQALSGYTFGSLFSWRAGFRYQFCFVAEDALLVAYEYPSGANLKLLQPIGNFSKQAEERLIQAAASLPTPLEIDGVSEAFLNEHVDFAARFDVRFDRDYANYIYAAEDLAKLAGRRYSKKRNLIAQVQAARVLSVETMSPGEVVGHCLEICRAMAYEKTTDGSLRTKEQDDFLRMELAAMEQALLYFGALGMEGILVRADGAIAGFSIFEPMSDDTVVVHFEKGDRSVKGIYQVLNQETAKVILKKGYAWINREDDLGNPGLRQAKESYYPARLEPFGRLVFRR